MTEQTDTGPRTILTYDDGSPIRMHVFDAEGGPAPGFCWCGGSRDNQIHPPDIYEYLKGELIRHGLADHEAARLLDIAASYGDRLRAEREARLGRRG